MKNWLFRSDGTVTIFCTLIMMFLVVFLMVLIDFSRILLFQRTTESALKLSAQSVISAYDRELYRRYGLFARGGSDAEQLFRQAMELNLLNSLSIFSVDQGSDFVQPKLERFELFETEYLGQHAVFERQVMEEMKYKAPIDFTLELLEQWLPLKDAVSKAEGMMTVMTELEKLFEDREQKLEQALSLQRQLGEKLGTSGFPTAATSSAQSTLNSYTQYVSWLSSESSLSLEIAQKLDVLDVEQLIELEERRYKYSSQISSYLYTAANVTTALSTETERLLVESEQLADQIDNLLQEARALDQTINIQYQLYLKGQSGSGTDGSSELKNELDKLDFDDSMIRGEQYYNQYRRAVREQQASLREILQDGSALGSQIRSLVDQPTINIEVNQRLNEANLLVVDLSSRIQQYRSNYESPAVLLAEWEQSMGSSREVRSQLAEYEQQFEESVAALDAIKALLSAEEGIKSVQASYDELQKRYQSNSERNASEGSSGQDSPELTGSSKKQAASSVTQLSSILQLMGNASAAVRDHVYLNEYVMGKYSSFPMGKLTGEGKLSQELLEVSQQEIEYILYGIHEPLANVLLAYGEIFAVRFAIRTIEGFVANRALTHPLLIFGAAVVHGIKQAVADMGELVREGKTELSRYAPVQVDYKQYLRLFLLLHMGGKEARLSRMIAVIEHNTGLTLLAVPTSITAQVELSMTLWSLPGLSNIAGAISPMDSEVEGNAYQRSELISASY